MAAWPLSDCHVNRNEVSEYILFMSTAWLRQTLFFTSILKKSLCVLCVFVFNKKILCASVFNSNCGFYWIKDAPSAVVKCLNEIMTNEIMTNEIMNTLRVRLLVSEKKSTGD